MISTTELKMTTLCLQCCFAVSRDRVGFLLYSISAAKKEIKVEIESIKTLAPAERGSEEARFLEHLEQYSVKTF